MILGEYFRSLRPETVDLFSPHRFDQETADQICSSINSAELLRMVAVTQIDGAERVVAYFLLRFSATEHEVVRYGKLGIQLDPDADCSIAPSVADDYQSQGLGSQLLAHLIALARNAGRKRILLWGGTREINVRAIHFYGKLGFRKVGEFEARGNNYDMMLEL